MKQDITVGIVLVNYNGFPFILECLDSLYKIDYRNVKIVVVDNASNDGSIEKAAKDNNRVKIILLSDNFGFSRANNEGVRWCLDNNCEYVLLLNNDTIVEADFLSKLMGKASSEELLIPKIYSYYDKELINNNVGSFDYWRGVTIPYFYGKKDSPQSEQIQLVGMASACAILIPRNAFKKIGFLDENYFLYWEDTDFIVRAIKSGFLIKFIPQAVIYHKEGGSSGGRASPLAIYYNNRNRLYFMSKYNKGVIGWMFFLGYFLIGRFLHIVIHLCRVQIKELKALVLGVLDFSRGKMGCLTPDRQRRFR